MSQEVKKNTDNSTPSPPVEISAITTEADINEGFSTATRHYSAILKADSGIHLVLLKAMLFTEAYADPDVEDNVILYDTETFSTILHQK